VIKYLGSKRTLVPLLSALAEASGARTALDLFTGTTRVAQAFKSQGLTVSAVDLASYSEVFARTWIALDARAANHAELTAALTDLNATPGEPGYFTKTFCEDARYFQPQNGAKVDAIRGRIEAEFKDTWMYFPLLTSLILASDRVDSTTGLQMAYLKSWATRSFKALEMRDPGLIAGEGFAYRGDALELAATLPPVDLAYLDPPYNQHRYFSNYHIWETLVRWDAPESYGIANKRLDVRDPETKSAFNSKREFQASIEKLLTDVRAETLILSYNNESWLTKDDLIAMCEPRGAVELIEVDFKRYVGAQIGIFNQAGKKVGEPQHKRNLEYVVLVGDKSKVSKMAQTAKQPLR
jgi:adenine-specific DNA-methyltransferase